MILFNSWLSHHPLTLAWLITGWSDHSQQYKCHQCHLWTNHHPVQKASPISYWNVSLAPSRQGITNVTREQISTKSTQGITNIIPGRIISTKYIGYHQCHLSTHQPCLGLRRQPCMWSEEKAPWKYATRDRYTLYYDFLGHDSFSDIVIKQILWETHKLLRSGIVWS